VNYQWIIMVGTPIDGFSCYGPFETEHEANQWGLDMYLQTAWCAMRVTPREKVC
jgi:hypothetical protein